MTTEEKKHGKRLEVEGTKGRLQTIGMGKEFRSKQQRPSLPNRLMSSTTHT
jgi:hypothetical protein